MRLYISGPMTGIPDHNFPAFNAAAAVLRQAGFEISNPADNGASDAVVVAGDRTWADYVRKDLLDMLGCEGLALLDGWHASKGARLEYHVAAELGMPIRSVEAWLPYGAWLSNTLPEPPPLLNPNADDRAEELPRLSEWGS